MLKIKTRQMTDYTITFTTRWADFDPNRHMRHTAYNDYAAEVRIRFFKANGFTLNDFAKFNIGPILFKESTNFVKEIHLGETITANIKLEACSKKAERWKIVHEVFNEQGKIAAQIKVYGAWIDLSKRKLTTPPKSILKTFESLQKTENFSKIKLKDE